MQVMDHANCQTLKGALQASVHNGLFICLGHLCEFMCMCPLPLVRPDVALGDRPCREVLLC